MNACKSLYCIVRMLFVVFTINYTLFNSALAHNVGLNIVVLNTERVLEQSVAVHEIRKSIQKISDRIEADLTQKEIELKRIELKIIQNASLIPAAEYDNKISAFNKDVSRAQKHVRLQKKELEKAYTSAMQEVHNEILSLVKTMAQAEHFDIVMPTSQVIFANDILDITPEISNRLNKSMRKVKINYQGIP